MKFFYDCDWADRFIDGEPALVVSTPSEEQPQEEVDDRIHDTKPFFLDLVFFFFWTLRFYRQAHYITSIASESEVGHLIVQEIYKEVEDEALMFIAEFHERLSLHGLAHHD